MALSFDPQKIKSQEFAAVTLRALQNLQNDMGVSLGVPGVKELCEKAVQSLKTMLVQQKAPIDQAI